MKIIFLDIDGVLNSQQYYISSRQNKVASESMDDYHKSQFDPAAVKHLNKITDETGAKIVLSSTWRHGMDQDAIDALFLLVGITGDCIGKTPVYRHKECRIPRGEEVRKWLDINGYKHNFRNYVIIDDDSDFLYNQRKNLFLTDNEFGLGGSCAYRIINFLNHDKL